MNVLIVDDQPEVVESMVTGVNWKKIPVEQVFTAYSCLLYTSDAADE